MAVAQGHNCATAYSVLGSGIRHDCDKKSRFKGDDMISENIIDFQERIFMNYLPTVGEQAPSWILLNVAGLIAGMVVMATLVTFMMYAPDALLPEKPDAKLPRNKKIVCTLLISVSVAFAFVTVISYHSYQKERAEGSANLVQNLKQKYDIKNVDFALADYKSFGYSQNFVSPDQAEAQTVIVVTNDDKKAVFILKQDPGSSEPTLSEITSTFGPHPAQIPLTGITRR